MAAREATYLISLATEEFIKHIAEESGIVASRENRVTVQYKVIGSSSISALSNILSDLSPASVVRRVEKFMFLDGQFLHHKKSPHSLNNLHRDPPPTGSSPTSTT